MTCRHLWTRNALAVTVAAVVIAACGKPAEPGAKTGGTGAAKRPPTQITVVHARTGTIESIESTLGTLESTDDPRLGAEIAGRITALPVLAGQPVRRGQLLAEIDPADAQSQRDVDVADVARLKSLLAQQERLVDRQAALVAKNFVAKNALDDAVAQRDALRSEMTSAQSRSQLSGRGVGKARVSAPTDAVIDEVLVSRGAYVKVGDPMFRLVATGSLRANLPFSEAVAPRLKRGQAVRLNSPLIPDVTLDARIDDLRPQVSDGGRSVIAIARLKADPRLKAGATVDASVLIGRRADAVLVPEQSVVLRPAGKVVYAVVDGKAQQRVVETGAQEGGFVEITRGLGAGETVALDGAGFLSQGAEVAVKSPPGAKSAGNPSGMPMSGMSGAM